jgi:transketolase
VAAAEDLARDDLDAAVAVVASLNPAPVASLTSLLSAFGMVMTVETHYVVGGLGSLVAEIIAEHGLRCRLARRGLSAAADAVVGSEEFLLARHGLTRAALAEAARGMVAPVS